MKEYHHLTQRNRYLIQDLLSLGKSKASIAKELGVDRSTVSREIVRNGNSRTVYNAKGAHATAFGRKRSTWDSRRKIEGLLEQVIIEKLQERWSPAQISGRLKKEKRWSISHATIYNWIYRLCPEAKVVLRRKS
jgi:IS30 family transposase